MTKILHDGDADHGFARGDSAIFLLSSEELVRPCRQAEMACFSGHGNCRESKSRRETASQVKESDTR